jgi:hypothetical protein
MERLTNKRKNKRKKERERMTDRQQREGLRQTDREEDRLNLLVFSIIRDHIFGNKLREDLGSILHYTQTHDGNFSEALIYLL